MIVRLQSPLRFCKEFENMKRVPEVQSNDLDLNTSNVLMATGHVEILAFKNDVWQTYECTDVPTGHMDKHIDDGVPLQATQNSVK